MWNELVKKVTTEELEEGRIAIGGGVVGAKTPFLIDYGKGSCVYDRDGRRFIDCTSQAWTLNTGYAHPKIIDAVKEFVNSLTHAKGIYETLPKLLLSKQLVQILPIGLNRLIYSLTGSEANEGAIKVAFRNTQGNTIVALFDGFHGRSLSTLNLSWPHPNNRFSSWSTPIIRIPQAYCYRCVLDKIFPECELACVSLAKELILRGATEKPVALIMEPIQGNGGMITFPKNYYSAIRKLCDDIGMLLIFDEVQTGFGRCGTWFAADLYEVTPDIMAIGKALGGGFPLSATIYSDRLKDLEAGDHGFTFGHFPVSMVAALANIQVIKEENLLERSCQLGTIATQRLLELMQKYDFIGDVRGPGLMIGVELVKNRKTKEPACHATQIFISEGFKRGVIFGESKYLGLGNVVKIKPPLVITENELEEALNVFEDICEMISRKEIFMM
jgi:4-aminobutyrate aminotransferase-like enzyme